MKAILCCAKICAPVRHLLSCAPYKTEHTHTRIWLLLFSVCLTTLQIAPFSCFKWQDDPWIINLKICETKRSWPTLRQAHNSGICLGELTKGRQNSWSPERELKLGPPEHEQLTAVASREIGSVRNSPLLILIPRQIRPAHTVLL
jgi:hypothetical protein